jgi:hypothetical protein
MEAIDSATWRKSTYSGSNGGGCVEAGSVEPGRVLIRDTTNRGGTVLDISAEAWLGFMRSLR